LKSFPSEFAIELARTDGPAPHWVLKIQKDSDTWYLSDIAGNIAVWDVTGYDAVSDWGAIQGGVNGSLDEFHVTEHTVRLLLGRAIDGSGNDLEDLIDAGSLFGATFTLYLGLSGIAVAPQIMDVYKLRDLGDMDDTTVTLQLQDLTADLEKCYIGSKLSLDDYPNADPDDVGKVIPIPFGNVTKIPALCINQTATYVYIFSDRPVTTAPHVYVRARDDLADIDITAHCTIYTGQTGSEHASYPGKGVLTIDSGHAASIQALVQFVLTDGIGVSDTIDVSTGSHGHTVSEVSREQVASNQGTTYGDSSSTSVNIQPTYPSVADIVEQTNYWTYSYGGNGYAKNVYINGVLVHSGSSSGSMQTWSGTTESLPHLYVENTSGTNCWARFEEVTRRVVTYTPTTSSDPATGVAKSGSASKTGTVTLDQPPYAKDIARLVLVSVTSDNYAPTDALDYILDQAGQSAVTNRVTLSDTYRFDGIINEYRTALQWLNILSFQVAARFAMVGGSPMLLPRWPGEHVKTIKSCIVDEGSGKRMLVRRLTPYEEIINRVIVLYNRDWTKSGDEAYRANYKAPDDTASIAKYSLHERPELFRFDFVTTAAHARTVGETFLRNHKERHWVAEFPRHLADMDLELGDTLLLEFLGDKVGIVIPAEPVPGSYQAADLIKLTVRI
jgi:hypothetical protein